MIQLKPEYENPIRNLMNELVLLGIRLKNCEDINSNLTSKEYKGQCIDEVKKEIEQIQNKIIRAIISLSDSKKLEYNLNFNIF